MHSVLLFCAIACAATALTAEAAAMPNEDISPEVQFVGVTSLKDSKDPAFDNNPNEDPAFSPSNNNGQHVHDLAFPPNHEHDEVLTMSEKTKDVGDPVFGAPHKDPAFSGPANPQTGGKHLHDPIFKPPKDGHKHEKKHGHKHSKHGDELLLTLKDEGSDDPAFDPNEDPAFSETNNNGQHMHDPAFPDEYDNHHEHDDVLIMKEKTKDIGDPVFGAPHKDPAFSGPANPRTRGKHLHDPIFKPPKDGHKHEKKHGHKHSKHGDELLLTLKDEGSDDPAFDPNEDPAFSPPNNNGQHMHDPAFQHKNDNHH